MAAKQPVARARARPASFAARPPRASVPAFGGWEVAAAGGGAAAAPDYSLDFSNIRAARMQRRKKALSWSSFIGNAAVAVESTTPGGGGGGEEVEKRQWSSETASDGDDDDRERHRRHQLRRLRSADIDDDRRQPIQPGRAVAKGKSKFKGYLFGCVGGRQW